MNIKEYFKNYDGPLNISESEADDEKEYEERRKKFLKEKYTKYYKFHLRHYELAWANLNGINEPEDKEIASSIQKVKKWLWEQVEECNKKLKELK